MIRFATASLLLTALVGAGAVLGGGWAWLALGCMTAGVAALDRVAALAAPDRPDRGEFPGSDTLLVVLGVAHLALLALAVPVLSGPADWTTKLPVFLSTALWLGQIGHPCAHELIHAAPRALRRLGVAVYCAILFGHHASAHALVHHVHAATDRDPNSARMGEGFWRFAPRAWAGSFHAGFRAERRRFPRGWTPYHAYVAGAALTMTAAWGLGGVAGLAWLIALAAYAQLQVLLADYVQHYGLRRQARADGRPEPVGPAHSWNAPHGVSSAMMLNAPRHSDHHMAPSRDYPALRLDRDAMPMLPHALPVMAVIALCPPLWRRVMDPLARKWADRQATEPSTPVVRAPVLAD